MIRLFLMFKHVFINRTPFGLILVFVLAALLKLEITVS